MDWTLLIGGLIERGLTRAQIATAIRCPQATFSDIASGKTKDPRSSVGIALLKLAHENGIDVQLPWEPTTSEVVLGRRAYTRDAVAAGCPPDAAGRRVNGPGRRATDRLVIEQGGGAASASGAQGAGQGGV